jgi:hypothetical protein
MKRQKNKNRGDFYRETIFNIAAYNCSRSYPIGGKNSKRATSKVAAIINYIDNLPETSKK